MYPTHPLGVCNEDFGDRRAIYLGTGLLDALSRHERVEEVVAYDNLVETIPTYSYRNRCNPTEFDSFEGIFWIRVDWRRYWRR